MMYITMTFVWMCACVCARKVYWCFVVVRGVVVMCDVMWQNMRELNVRMIICGVCMLWVRVRVVSVCMWYSVWCDVTT